MTLLWNKREFVARIHFKNHLHLANCIHLKRQLHMQNTKMRVELLHLPELSLIKELSALQKSPSLRDPSTSPLWRTSSVGSLSQRFDRETWKDEASCSKNGSRTSRRMVSIASNISRNTARQNTNNLQEAVDFNGIEGWVEIWPADGNTEGKSTLKTGSSSTLKERATSHHCRIKGKIRDPNSKFASKFKKGETYDMLAYKKEDFDKQKGFSDMPLKNDSHVLGSNHGKQRREGTSSRGNRARGASLKCERDVSSFGSHSTGQLKPWNRDVSAGGNGEIQRRMISHLQSSPSQMNITSSSQGQQNWRSSALIDKVGAMACGGNDELDISDLPQNRCGIHWNWSRIHSRGKNMLDMAGKSLSCRASDPVNTKVYQGHQSSPRESMPGTTSEFSDTSLNTDSESLPLLDLLESGSQSEQGLGQDQTDSSGSYPNNTGRQFTGGRVLSSSKNRHCSLSRKYMPKSFHDIVGQHLVTQALSNALSRGRVAPMYIFYGPQGTGKTSCAGVFAAALNCLSSREERPCGSCRECLGHSFEMTSIFKEVNAGGHHQVRSIKTLMHDVVWSSSSKYKVYIVDECHSLSSNAWKSFLKIVEQAPRNIVFILSTSSLEQMPNAVVSRCQKFHFSKIKESEIVIRLQHIALQEGLTADTEAFRLIASTSDGSLQDAEMMLDQLSLLGQKISVSMVRELMGLIPDTNLLELLDFALSADTVNTVRSLRDSMDSGIEPLNLISQLACLITRILAGGYQLPKGRQRRKFFQKQELTKDDMERLRKALKILSEAEKQLRGSPDRMTWLTAALLQFAPDQSYLLPSCSADTSVTQSPIVLNDVNEIPELCSSSQKHTETELQYANYSKPEDVISCEEAASKRADSFKISVLDPSQPSPQSRGRHVVSANEHFETLSSRQFNDRGETTTLHMTLTNDADLEDVWQRVLDSVHSNSLRKFLQNQGKLLSLSICKGFAVARLEFCQHEHASRAERSRTSIGHAFQVTLGYCVEIKVHLASKTEEQVTRQAISGSQTSNSSNVWQSGWMSGDAIAYSGHMVAVEAGNEHGQGGIQITNMHQKLPQSLKAYDMVHPHSVKTQNDSQRSNQICETVALETWRPGGRPTTSKNHSYGGKEKNAWVQESAYHDTTGSSRKIDKHSEDAGYKSNGTGKSKVSLGFVIQQPEGRVERYSQDMQFSVMHEGQNEKKMRHDVPEFVLSSAQEGHSEMAAKMEEQNLKLESRSGGLLCWKTTDRGNEKVKQLQQSPRRPGFMSSLCPCARSNNL